MRCINRLTLQFAGPVEALLTIEQTYLDGLDIPSLFVSDSFENTAVNIVKNKLGLTDGDVAYNSGYSSDTADHAYLKQSYVSVLHSSTRGAISFPTRMEFRSSMPLQI